MKLEKVIAGAFILIGLVGCEIDFKENSKQKKAIIKLATTEEVIQRQKTQKELCADYGKKFNCVFQFGIPFYNMDTSMGELCNYCGERFSSCILAYQSDCEGIFPGESECSGESNCILKCFEEGFCENDATYGIL